MADRLNLLISSCTGEAKESIADCILARSPDLGYYEARRILEVNFGQEHAIVSAYVRKLTEGPAIRSNDKSALAELVRDMRNCEISCGGMSSAGMDTQHTVASIFKRLPANLQDKFMASVGPQLERGQPILLSQLFTSAYVFVFLARCWCAGAGYIALRISRLTINVTLFSFRPKNVLHFKYVFIFPYSSKKN